MPASGLRSRGAPARFWRDRNLPFVEARETRDARDCFRPHSHPTLSAGIVDTGGSVLTLPDREVPLRAGDVVLINAHVVHACNPRSGRWSYRTFYFDVAWARAVLLDQGLAEFPYCPQPLRQARARESLDAMSRVTTSSQSTAERTAALARALATLFRCARPAAAQPRSDQPPLMAHVRAYLDERLDEKVTLAELARFAGLGPFMLLRRFRQAYGLTPHGYQIDRRINRARALLGRGMRAIDVAYLTGFADQSHLHRCFRARVAITPRRFATADAR